MSYHEYYNSLPTTILQNIFSKMNDLQKQINELRILITNPPTKMENLLGQFQNLVDFNNDGEITQSDFDEAYNLGADGYANLVSQLGLDPSITYNNWKGLYDSWSKFWYCPNMKKADFLTGDYANLIDFNNDNKITYVDANEADMDLDLYLNIVAKFNLNSSITHSQWMQLYWTYIDTHPDFPSAAD
jgi:hypothetical protein